MTTHREPTAQCFSAFLRDDPNALNSDVHASIVNHTAKPSINMALQRQRYATNTRAGATPPLTPLGRAPQACERLSPRNNHIRSIPLKLVLMLASVLLVFIKPPSCSCIVRFFSADDLRYTFGVDQVSDVPDNYKHFHPRLIFLNDDEINRAKTFRYTYATAENDSSTTGEEFDAVTPRRLHGIQINFDKPDRSHDREAAGTVRLELEPVTRQLYADQLTVVKRSEAHGAGELEINRLNEAWSQAYADVDRSLWTDDCHYHHKSNDTYAAISNCDGSLKGIIVRENGIYIIHPIPERHAARLKRSADNLPLHVLYKRDSLFEQDNFCGIENTITSEELQEDEAGVVEDVFVVGQRLVQDSELVVELAIFVDELLWRQFSAKYGSAAWQRLQQYAVTMLSNIQIMYKQPSAVPQLTFKIVRYEVFMTQPSALAPQFHDNGHAQRYLDRFCRYQRSLGLRDWDHALLLTGYDIHRGSGSRSISGIARLDGMCDPWNTCTLAEGLDFTSAFIGTHELGHSVGMRHDEPYCQSRFIMSASLGPGKVTWSTCSLRDYHTFLQRMDARRKNCLRTSLLREKIPLTDALKPGQIYNANLQCSLMHGNGYVQVSPRQDHYDSICYMMWCGQGAYGRIITSHPALEGTFCGPSKWCQLGRCVPWTGYGAALTVPPTLPPPQAVPPPSPPPRLPITVTTLRPTAPSKLNGSWSVWSAFSCQHCFCSPIVGSIGVALSTRSCNNPTPLNGGQECTGSAQRAAVCAHKCPAESVSVDNFISNKCAEHKRINKDEELTGSGSQLNRFPQRACKIFCDVNTKSSERNYRFYGDNLPDGTPCGWDRYCVSGECIDMSCEGSALVAHDVLCPQPSERCPINTAVAATASSISAVVLQQSQKGQWSTWSAWSTCTMSCGPPGGFQMRSRVCSVGNRCEGQPTERQVCNVHACPSPPVVTEPQWTEWTEWNQCSVSCGRGSQARYRRCQTPQAVIAFSCSGRTMDIRNCEELPCSAFTTTPFLTGEWALWGTWSACSTTCGPGSQSRSRTCRKEPCDGAGQQRLACNLHECAQWNEWGAWSECSRLCDKGIRSRTRACPNSGNCAGSSMEQGFCSEQPCTGAVGQWTGWSEWGACSLTCGAGVKRRSRHCAGSNCSGNPRESVICMEATCNGVNDASWGGWGFWSTCSETCGNGVRRRVRKCYGSGNCFGNEFEREQCNERSCETDQKLQQIFH